MGKEKETEKKLLEDLFREYARRGFTAPTTTEIAERLRERTAGTIAEFGARLGLEARKEAWTSAEREKQRRFALRTRSLEQELALQRLKKQYEYNKRLLEWQLQKQKEMMKSAMKKQRRYGLQQLGWSMGLGAAAAWAAPSLFGLTKEVAGKTVPIGLGQRLLAGGVLGLGGLGELLGTRLAPSLYGDLANLYKGG
ncbi:MAG: hypothetical protein J7L34_09320 [Thermotogaceae bacterium]|nr:hypothetical protein [Thermotogaceae bacterium]